MTSPVGHLGGTVLAHLGPDGLPLPFTWRELGENWYVEPGMMVGILWIAMVYLVCWYRRRADPAPLLPWWRPWVFIGGLVAFVASVEGPFDRYGDVTAGVHMAQHMVLLYVVAPLLVAGAPLTVIRRGLSPGLRRRWVEPVLHSRAVRALTSPWIAAAFYVAVMVATHFTPWYDAALENVRIHQAEHLAYLAAGFVFFTILFGRDGRAVRRSAAQRLLVVLALEPVMTAMAVVFIVAPDPLYPFYVDLPAPWGGTAAALASQQVSGGVMWLPSTLVNMGLLAALVVAWYRADEAEAESAGPPVSPGDGVVDPGEGAGLLELVGEGQQRPLVAVGGGELDRPRQPVGAQRGR